ncbi:23S ribosomal RNA methyltransferase Erm [Lederbergia wuyishanensis]|uniref:rRNA adenine N-6-methyltransferase n=1 Tax=Lederbergia wuyishanensis TaxID=1347903 RepID=A0ABU0D6D2_9BACI|nr:23S ribosomal RNA methyltransferase Erm [Lederbergia wuyishanensis]MCJ8008616.1 23S ribosomal RNA methyltransferase Erm [Lederbergia wuyishanensis]MDQ0343968.1 23S rRNA (adenine-N6)-dimethyltransferase [Lederbergia wuyishanensis]
MTKRTHRYSNKKLSRGEPPNFSGQHLMHNKKLLHEIVDRANISKKDTALELGAGKGTLTTVLNERAGKVLAVEYDSKFVEILTKKTAEYKNTKIIHQDIMKIHLPREKFVVVSNIPFSITTPIMKMLLNNPLTGLQRGVIVMEKGAAKRFTSKFVKNHYVLAWRMWFDLYYIKEISRDHFSPPPRVDSAILLIKRKVEPIVSYKYYATFLGLAEYSLNNPNLSMDIALKGIFTPLQMKKLKRSLSIQQDTPIGRLTESHWGIIFDTMTKYVQRPLWPRTKKKL